jgi:hypothetical protein
MTGAEHTLKILERYRADVEKDLDILNEKIKRCKKQIKKEKK